MNCSIHKNCVITCVWGRKNQGNCWYHSSSEPVTVLSDEERKKMLQGLKALGSASPGTFADVIALIGLAFISWAFVQLISLSHRLAF